MHLTGNATFSISMIISGWCFLVFVFGFFGGGWVFWVCLVRISLAAFWFMFRSRSTTTSTCFYTELLTSQMPLKQDYANDESLGTCLCWISCKCLFEFSKIIFYFLSVWKYTGYPCWLKLCGMINKNSLQLFYWWKYWMILHSK